MEARRWKCDLKNRQVRLGARTFAEHLQEVLTLEAVGSKDWLINKVDRSVTGKVAGNKVWARCRFRSPTLVP